MHSSRGENQTPYKIDHHGLHKRWTSEIDDAGNSFDVEQPHFYTLIHEVQKQVHIPMPSNACFGFDSTTGWTFFDLNSLHDEYRDELGTVVEADFVRLNYLVLNFIVGSNTDMHDAGHKSLPMILMDFNPMMGYVLTYGINRFKSLLHLVFSLNIAIFVMKFQRCGHLPIKKGW
jgi:hypothetical protein